jgi:hypothetical protein
MKIDQSPEPLRSPPARTPASEGGMKRSLTAILVAVETQMAPTEESWHHWVKDFPPQRESMSAWCLLILHWWLVESKRAEPYES